MTAMLDHQPTAPELPRWDLASVYSDVNDPAYASDVERLFADIATLADRFDALGIDTRETDIPSNPDDDVDAFDEIITTLNDILERTDIISAYLYATVTADTRDDRAQARMSEFDERSVLLKRLTPRLTGWIGSLDREMLTERSENARSHAYLIENAAKERHHLLTPAEEDLLARLNPSGPAGWEKLHQDLTAQIVVPFARIEGDAAEELPITEVRNLAFDPDREVRRRALVAEIAAWEANALPLAAALNGITGTVGVVTKRRGWASPLDAALHENRIDRQTLDALLTSAECAFPVFRRYLVAKAKLLGVERLAWYDLFAPTGHPVEPGDTSRWTYANCAAFVTEQFGQFSDKMQAMARTAFSERWVDAGPRPGKVGGAYCMSWRRGESRILANHQDAYTGASTLAHELGHAYHNLVQADLPELRRGSPMTLAETASTFCEKIVRDAALKDASKDEQLVILESYLQDATQVVLDICSRFRFESAVFAARESRQLGVDELCELMLDTQRQTYGDAIAGDARHPFMWCVKSHYYTTRSFYNFPYLFGLLFSVGLSARYADDPDSFRSSYDELLANTGQANAAELAARFGVDLRAGEFWTSSLASLEADVVRFEGLVEARTHLTR